jgi:hypothetical protein
LYSGLGIKAVIVLKENNYLFSLIQSSVRLISILPEETMVFLSAVRHFFSGKKGISDE